MRKNEIKRSYHQGTNGLPMINVKTHGVSLPDYDDIIRGLKDEFDIDITEDQAEHALELWFDSAQEMFWQNIEETAQDVFGPDVKVYSAGRSAGWLVVQGLDDVDAWAGPQVSKWSKFARLVSEDIKDRAQVSNAVSDIEANKWYQTGAERYNFVETTSGNKCISELKAEALAQGFGPVIRK